MKCPFCGHIEDKVVDSRTMTNGDAIRRRRECLGCTRRFTTYEQIESIPLMVIKRDKRREPFTRGKVIMGLRRACEKRPVSEKQIEDIVDEVERRLHNLDDREVEATYIGETVMTLLCDVDQVAYVRFASVYRDFKDVGQFMEELRTLLKNGKLPVYREIGPKGSAEPVPAVRDSREGGD